MKMKTFNKATFLALALMLLFVQLSFVVTALDKTFEKTPFEEEIGMPGFEQEVGDYDELREVFIISDLEILDLAQPGDEELHPIQANSSKPTTPPTTPPPSGGGTGGTGGGGGGGGSSGGGGNTGGGTIIVTPPPVKCIPGYIGKGTGGINYNYCSRGFKCPGGQIHD